MSEEKLTEIKNIVEKPLNVFEILSKINVNDHTEKKNGLTYLSWSWAWDIVKKKFPHSSYTVDQYDGKPYLYDENLGYMVSTKVKIAGEELGMHLPVMDGANKAMKSKPYTYKTKYGDKFVDSASMFDINKTIMRCLVKNLAMFGLGLYIYSGEDLPEEAPKDAPEQPKTANIGTLKDQVMSAYKLVKTPDDKLKSWVANIDNHTAEQLQNGLKKLQLIK